MILACNHEEALQNRRRSSVDFFRGYRTDLIAPPAGSVPQPQAFLVEQDPGFELSTHFHMQHQFQLVAGGGGSLGKHVLRPWSVHYTTPESGYGPIVAGPEGLSYFTIRLMAESGAWKLPEERSRMRSGLKKKQRTAVTPEGGWPKGAGATAVHDIIPAEPDGLGAWCLDLGANQELHLPAAHAGGGCFLAVTTGSLMFDGRIYTPMAVFFVPRDAPGSAIRAGGSGARLNALQFPVDALNPDSAKP